MHGLQELMLKTLSLRLRRSSITSRSNWALEYRIMGPPLPGPWSFDHHPWTKAMHDSEGINVGEKAAQMGFTETLLNIAFAELDLNRRDVLYILPAKHPDATDFSATRFNPAIEYSQHLNDLFSETNNLGLKRAGSASLYIRGSRSKSGLRSIPAPILLFDEVDEMEQANIPLAEERASGQFYKLNWKISTPKILNYGIDKYFQQSNKQLFTFKCPCCSKFIILKYPDCVKVTGESLTDPKLKESYYFCPECKGILDHRAKKEFLSLENGSHWIKQAQSDIHGWKIPQLYSATITPYEFAQAVVKAQNDPTEEQELFNSKLGEPHVVEGAQVNDSHIDNCIQKGYKKQEYNSNNRLVTMGIDVGSWLHYEIAEWIFDHKDIGNDLNMRATCKLLTEGKVSDFEDLDQLMKQFQVLQAVIDMNPDRRKAFEFAKRFNGHVKLCFYGRSMHSRHINLEKSEEINITVDRTSWMDAALSRFFTKRIILPTNLSVEYKNQIKVPARIYEKDVDGNPMGKYLSTNDDHFAHARTYNEIALIFAASTAFHKDITNLL